MTNNQADKPAPTPARPALRQRSDIAAQAAQEWHDLETALAQARHDLTQADAEIVVMRERVKAMKADNEALLSDRDYHKDRHTAIETRLYSCARILADLMEAPNVQTINEPEDTRIEAAKKAVEQELGGVGGVSSNVTVAAVN